MEDRLLSSAVLACLVAVFGWYGISALLKAYRATDSATWTEQAIQGGLGVIGSAVFVDVVMHLLA